MRFVFFFFFSLSLFSADFDCVLVGTSPFSLFEALYQAHSGKKVLILEEAAQCGGAWKSIEICGVPRVDLGCHQIGSNMDLKQFLEEYAGCKIVSMDNPCLPFEKEHSQNGYYFSEGCFELIDHLLRLIAATDIVLLTEHKLETIWVDAAQKIATIQTGNQTFTTRKVIVTPMSCLELNPSACSQNYKKQKYYHLYLLIQDPTPPRFTYRSNGVNGSSRLMNLTSFLGLAPTGRQLIVIQTHHEKNLGNGQTFLDALIQQQLVDPAAYILREEPYIYETGSFHRGLISQTGGEELIELLQTGHFQTLSQYIERWKQVLKPYAIALQN